MCRQAPEYISIDGQNHSMECCPLEPYIKKYDIITALYAKLGVRGYSTDCYRGYVGSWEIESGKLYLVGLNISPTLFTDLMNCTVEAADIKVDKGRKLANIFSNWFGLHPPATDCTDEEMTDFLIRGRDYGNFMHLVFGKQKLFASWFSGVLHISAGSSIYSAPRSSMTGDIYEYDICYVFDKGVLKERKVIENHKKPEVKRILRHQKWSRVIRWTKDKLRSS